MTLSKAEDKKLEEKLLRDGTSAGPVTKEMIEYCRELYAGKNYEFWPDGLSLARLALGRVDDEDEERQSQV